MRRAVAAALLAALALGCERAPSAPRAAAPGLSPDERPFSLPLNNPGFVPAASAAHMRGDDLVVGVVVAGRARAYPWWMLRAYHVVNDSVALTPEQAVREPGAMSPRGRADGDLIDFVPHLPLLVAGCEACAAAAAYVPSVGGRSLVFAQMRGRGGPGDYNAVGTYTIVDLETLSRWHPFAGVAKSGPLAGTRLRRLPTLTESWARWVKRHPDTEVLLGAAELRARPHAPHPLRVISRDVQGAMHPSLRAALAADPKRRDGRLPPYELVIGVDGGEGAFACPLAALRSSGGARALTHQGRAFVLALTDEEHALAFVAPPGVTAPPARLRSRLPFRLEDGTAESGGPSLAPAAEQYVATWDEWSQAHPAAALPCSNAARTP